MYTAFCIVTGDLNFYYIGRNLCFTTQIWVKSEEPFKRRITAAPPSITTTHHDGGLPSTLSYTLANDNSPADERVSLSRGQATLERRTKKHAHHSTWNCHVENWCGNTSHPCVHDKITKKRESRESHQPGWIQSLMWGKRNLQKRLPDSNETRSQSNPQGTIWWRRRKRWRPALDKWDTAESVGQEGEEHNAKK